MEPYHPKAIAHCMRRRWKILDDSETDYLETTTKVDALDVALSFNKKQKVVFVLKYKEHVKNGFFVSASF